MPTKINIALVLTLVPLMAFESFVLIARPDDWIVTRALSLFIIVCSTFTLSLAWHQWYRNKAMTAMLAPLPKSVSFSTDDDGEVTALVERVSGEPVVLTIPREVASQGPDAAMAWVFHTLTR